MDDEVRAFNFDKFKRARSLLRRITTIALDKLEELLNAERLDSLLIEEQYVMTRDKIERLFEIDRKMEDLLLEWPGGEEEWIKELEKIEHYRDRWLTLDLKKHRLLKCVLNDTGSTNQRKTRNIKLFKLQPKKFDGKLHNWIGFWTMYCRIHEDEELGDDEKFQYLLQFTLEGSPARELLESFPPSAENYPKAVDQLRKRFGRRGLLIKMYVRELIKVANAQVYGDIKMPLRTLYDKLETQLRALETLGVAKDDFANMLLPLVESSLPENILREWERIGAAEDVDEEEAGHMHLEPLLTFLRREVESEERMALARQTFSKNVDETHNRKEGKYRATPTVKKDISPTRHNKNFSHSEAKEIIPSAAELMNIKTQLKDTSKCIFCEGVHSSENCFKARTMEASSIKKILKIKGCCFSCFKWGHTLKQCKLKSRCIICDKRHHPLLCLHRMQRKNADENEKAEKEHNLTNTNFNFVLLQTLTVKVRGEREHTARVLIDTGSQRSYITHKLARLMKLQPLREEKLTHILFGGTQTEVTRHKCYKVRLASLNKSYNCNFEALNTEQICSSLPVVAKGPWVEELKNKGIILSDVEGPIDILVGADIAGKILTGKKETLSNGLVAIETLLGWTIMGKVPRNDKENNINTHINLLTANMNVSDLWRLDILGIEDPIRVKTRQERNLEALHHFEENVEVQKDGRYEVGLPWVDGRPRLPRNFDLAKRRLESTIKKLKVSDKVKAYENVFIDWLNNNIIEEIPFKNWDVGYYLPHRPVFKEESTTKIRPVFDASAKAVGYPSLNQCLEKGINFIELIPSILLRFRLKRIGVTADIEKAFLQISLREEDRDYLRFLWLDSQGKLRIFRHQRVVFGLTSSPFLLGAVINHHLNMCKGLTCSKQVEYSLNTIDMLFRGLYVDNCLVSLADEEQLRCFVTEATTIFAKAQFNLRGWEYSDPNCSGITDTHVLGLIWDRKNDTLKLNKVNWDRIKDSRLTRRTLLATTQKLFDIVGVTCPTSLVPKLLLQRTWTAGGEWDSDVDPDTKKKFARWLEEIPYIQELEIPRWVEYSQKEAVRSLHVFCDASQVAYAACCFLRVEHNNRVAVYLLQAKSRVAPLGNTTIPRLELLAASIGARLANRLLEDLPDVKLFCWSDSTTVLTWIKREEPWGVFVRNRVEEIRKLSNPETWRHVPGHLNPADLASRGCSPKTLLQSRWWEGPLWLCSPTSDWPSTTVVPDEDEVGSERKKTVMISLSSAGKETVLEELSHRLSKYSKIIRVLGWMIRFAHNSKPKTVKRIGELSVEEVEKGEKIILKFVQSESFEGVSDARLKILRPFLDNFGVIRLKTKISQRTDSEDFRLPIVLPAKHDITEKLINYTHLKRNHVSGQNLLNILREKYWVLQGRQVIRRVINKCIVCRRYKASALEVETPALPEERVRDASIFEITGTDLAGPLYVRDGGKVWVALFTCAVFRAVHFDIVASLSTDDFMMAFRRFVARRGRPKVMFSDNGTNFKGMNNAINSIDWNRVVAYSSMEKIEWRFSPPSAPWWGGFWERMVGLLKNLLRRTLGKTSLTREELRTVLIECEATINARPITYVSNDNSDPVPISPQMFLKEIQEISVPECDAIERLSLQKRIRYRQRLRDDIRRRFRSEYLGQLKFKEKTRKETRNPIIGEVVLIGSEDKRRMDWPMAVVKEVYPGKDGKCRVVRLLTPNGELCRPVQKVFPLEIFSSSDDTNSKNSDGSQEKVEPNLPNDREEESSVGDTGREVTTRCGRVVKLPMRF